MPRQQRGDNSRGQLPQPNRRTTADLEWRITSVVGNVVELEISGISGIPALYSPPGFTIPGFGGFLSGTAITGTTISLTFNVNVPDPFTLELGPLDPGIRTSSGAYLAAGANASTNPFPRASVPTYEATQDANPITKTVTIENNVAGGTIVLPPTPIVGDTWFIGGEPLAGTVNIAGTTPGPSTSVNGGTLWVFTWSGSTWNALQLI